VVPAVPAGRGHRAPVTPPATVGSSAPPGSPTTDPRALDGAEAVTHHRAAADQRGSGGTDGSGRPSRASLRLLWPYLRPHRTILLIVTAISVVGAALAVAQPAVVALVITSVQDSRPLAGVVTLLVVLVLAGAVINGIQSYLLQRTAEGVVLDTRRLLVHRLLRLPIPEFDTRRTGDLVSRVGSDTTLLRAVITSGLVDAVSGVLVFAGSVIAMALISPLLLGLTLVVVALAVAVVVGLGGRIQSLTLTAQTQVGILAAGVGRAVPGVRTIRAAGATDRENEELDALAGNAYSTGVRLAKVMALIAPIIGVALQGAFILVLGVGGYLVADGSMQVAELVAFILYLFMMIMPLGRVFQAYTATQNALGAVIRIQEITSLPEEEDAPSAESVPVPGPAGVAVRFERAGAAAVRFDGVNFGYGAHGVLRGVSFAVPVGTKTAIVGPSGAGKSTILALIERFYDPDAGRISVGGVDVRDLSRARVRSLMGYVEQDSPVLAGTIKENLLLGAPAASEADCVAVLAAVNLTGVLERDPAGLDAQVGEDGIMLSGGERQRLAIARALLAGPPILLLDEPTASLDGRNEQALRQAIDAVSVDRTLILVAHRLATVVDADQILVLEAGRLEAAGTHESLLQTSALYRELAEHQLLA
jgi:ABC-type multidrug transport system fused ATPase/permease subunit